MIYLSFYHLWCYDVVTIIMLQVLGIAESVISQEYSRAKDIVDHDWPQIVFLDLVCEWAICIFYLRS